MIRALAAGALACALAGCNAETLKATLGTVNADIASASIVLANNCNALQLVAATVDASVSAKSKAAADQAQAALASVCQNPPADMAGAVVTAAKAYAAVKAAQASGG